MCSPLGFAPVAALEDLFCRGEGQGWGWCSCLDRRGSGSTRYSGELAARAAENIVLWKAMATSIGQYGPVLLPGGALSLTEEPGRPQSTSLQRSGHDQSNPVHIDTRRFVPVAALPPWELSVKVAQLPGLQGQGQSPRQELWPYQSLFRRLFWRPLWPVFLRSSTHSGP